MLRRCMRIFLSANFLRGVFLMLFILFFYNANKSISEDMTYDEIAEASPKITSSPEERQANIYVQEQVKKEQIKLDQDGEELVRDHFSNKVISQSDWREVKKSERSLFVYSAYYDTRKSPLVRLVVIIKKKFKVKHCQIWTEKGNIIKTNAQFKSIRENWGLLYTSAFVMCDGFTLPKGDSVTHVAVLLPNTESLETKLPVIKLDDQKLEGNFSVCVKAFHYEFNRAIWLVEFIEMHRILGVEKFIFYNHTVGPDVEAVLRYYIEKNIVEIYPWTLPVKTQKEIRTEGIFAALNDCSLKSVGRYRYAIMIDIDEFIIPRKTNNYHELIQSLGDYSVYVFQNDFFYLYWDNDTTASEILYGSTDAVGRQLYGSEAEGPYLLTAYKTTRLKKPHQHGQRSKYIVKPEKAVECGNHIVWEMIGKKSVINVKDTDALVHHYRICEFGGFDCLKKPKEVDRSAHKWLESLMRAVGKTCSDVFQPKGACPKAPPLGSPW